MKKSENENLRIKKSENGKSETNYNLVLLVSILINDLISFNRKLHGFFVLIHLL